MFFKKTVVLLALLLLSITFMYAEKSLERIGNEFAAEGDELFNTSKFSEAAGKYQAALAKFREAKAENSAIDITAKEGQMLQNIVSSFYSAKDYPNTVKAMKSQLAYKPNDRKIPFQIAQVYAKLLKDYNNAIAVLKDYDAKKADFKARKKIAIYYNKLKDTANAILWYNKALELKQDANVINLVANLYVDQGNNAKAIKMFEDFIATKPSNRILVKVYSNLGVLYEKLNQSTQAAKYYEKSVAIKYNYKINLKLLSLYFNTENYSQAKKKADFLLTKNSKDYDALYFMAQIKYKRGDKLGAKADFEKLTKHSRYGTMAAKFIESIKSEL